MATRSHVGVKTESGLVGFYTHWDGSPETRLPLLRKLIDRDGAQKVGQVLMENGDRGGWSSLQAEGEITNSLDERGEVIPGYGLAYRDCPVSLPTPQGKDKEEYAYYIDTETGDIIWFDYNSSDHTPRIDKA